MCGIAGFISLKYKKQHLKRMTNALSHRGPDAEGFFMEEEQGVGLGHRRLSILDLSEAGNQPFYSKDGRFIMIYNGEIYNYQDIAKKNNIATKTSSDTEVIIEHFVKKGIACIEDFNGMFALAIWDTIEEKLYITRDRVGIKPLYYYWDGQNFAFASEIKAILQLPVDKALDYSAITNYLYLGYFPEEQSVFKHIRKFPAGCTGILSKNEFSITPYWTLESTITPSTIKNEKQAKQELKTLLIESVKGQMISDVPLGTFLSGGIDSSTVTAVAQQLSDKPVKTFSIGFKEDRFNESKYARMVANYLKTDHHEFILSTDDALEKITHLLDIYDEPYGDSSAIPTLLVSEMARKHVTVTLSGDGGDELFMGYGAYLWAKRIDNPALKLFRKPLLKALHLSGNQRLKRGSFVLDYSNPKRIKSHIFSQEQYLFSEKLLDHVLLNNSILTFDENLDSVNRKLSAAEQQSFFDFKNYLKDDLLVKVDRASMYHSLESRVPLLDNNIIEFAVNLDETLKYKKGIAKYLLKEVLYDFIPSSYFDRPKQGFSIPLVKWLKRDLRYLLDEHLSEESVVKNNICDYLEVQKLKSAYFNGVDYHYNRLWILVLLHKWLNENL